MPTAAPLRRPRRSFVALAAALIALAGGVPVPSAARTSAPPPPAAVSGVVPLAGPGLVSAADPRAAAAGARILREGGSATDAAIATMLALSVVEPQSTGLGGGGFLVTGDAAGKVETIDGRETAPAAATPGWFIRDGRALTPSEAVPGGLSVGVPGNLRMAALAHARHGRLAWRRLFRPAIALARDGFRVTPRLRSTLALGKETAALDPVGRALYFDAAGEPVPVGTLIRNPALARVLERVAARGPDAFYRGANAAAIAAAVTASPRNPAPLAAGDLAGYAARERPALCGAYRGYRICGMGPPSAGGIIVLQTLGALERFDLAALGPNSPVAWHLIAEAERLAFADRDRFIADPDFVKVPAAGLIDPAYIAARSALISATATIPAVVPGTPAGVTTTFAAAPPGDEHGTTHCVAVDRWGNAASMTSTVEGAFGSGLVVNGYFLNNELTDFNLTPDRDGVPTANRVEPGKRPRSSMSPVIVYAPGGAMWLIAGGAGGATIPTQVIRLIIGKIDWGLSAREAITLGVVMPTHDSLVVEAGTPLEAMIPALAALGHTKVNAAPLRIKANAIERVVTGTGAGETGWRGAADPRSEGAAATP